MHVDLERTFLTTAAGRAVIFQTAERFTVEATSLREAMIAFIEESGGRILGTISELPNRAVCTAWASGRLFVLTASSAPD